MCARVLDCHTAMLVDGVRYEPHSDLRHIRAGGRIGNADVVGCVGDPTVYDTVAVYRARGFDEELVVVSLEETKQGRQRVTAYASAKWVDSGSPTH